MQFLRFGYEIADFGYLISIPKAWSVFLAHKGGDARFSVCSSNGRALSLPSSSQHFWDSIFLPMFLASCIFAQGIYLFALLFCLGTGDIFLKFALEDEWFFALAIGCHALSIFEDTELFFASTRELSPVRKAIKSRKFDRFTYKRRLRHQTAPVPS